MLQFFDIEYRMGHLTGEIFPLYISLFVKVWGDSRIWVDEEFGDPPESSTESEDSDMPGMSCTGIVFQINFLQIVDSV